MKWAMFRRHIGPDGGGPLDPVWLECERHVDSSGVSFRYADSTGVLVNLMQSQFRVMARMDPDRYRCDLMDRVDELQAELAELEDELTDAREATAGRRQFGDELAELKARVAALEASRR